MILLSGYKIPITDEIVLMTSIGFDYLGKSYKMFLRIRGNVLIELILFCKGYSCSLVGRVPKRSKWITY